jgi:hypothetical protein
LGDSRGDEMNEMKRMWRIPGLLLVVSGAALMLGCQLNAAGAHGQEAGAQQGTAPAQGESGLVIENDSELPDTFPRAPYEFRFRARGGVPPLHWQLESGAPPPGMKLEDDGLLHGQAERIGEFQFTVSVKDSGKPQAALQKGFFLRVKSALSLKWKNPAHVNGNRIEGSVEVSNTTPDDIDLTFIVVAVPPNGRATAIGYQHFVLPQSTVPKELPFGETLPSGAYVVHVVAVGEVAAKNLIYRDRMESPGALQVTVGP